MLNAILYKEFIKTYKVILIFIAIFTYSLFDTFLDTKNTIEFYEATSAILNITLLGRFDFNFIKFISIIFAISLGVAQFYPEIASGRIRLYLHLPMSHFKLISILIFSGLGLLSLVFSIIWFSYYMILSSYFPVEVFDAINSKLTPFFLASIFAYLTTLLAFLEPKIDKKVLYVMISLAVLILYLKYSQITYFVSDFMNIIMGVIICIYILTIYEAFTTYTKGYIK